MKQLIRILPLMVTVLLAAGSAHAIPLSDLFNGGSITVGDKLFDKWQLSATVLGSDPQFQCRQHRRPGTHRRWHESGPRPELFSIQQRIERNWRWNLCLY